MAVGRPVLAFLALFLLAGALVLMFLTFLAGVTNTVPLRDVYFLQADTSGIDGAPALSRWTFWNVCGVSNGHNACKKVHPAYPLDPQKNFGTQDGVPAGFLGTESYYLETRFAFAFIIIALFFGLCGLFTGLFALCSRIGSYLSGLFHMLALIFQAVSSALMTAAYINGRNIFRNAGDSAQVGKYAFGFMWAATLCLILSSMLVCVSGAMSKDKYKTGGHRTIFGRSKSVRSTNRGSFSGTKDEYA